MKMREVPFYYSFSPSEILGVDFERTLAKGYPTEISLARDTTDPKVKKIVKIFISDETRAGRRAMRHFLTEVKVFLNTDHPNIMKMESAAMFPICSGIVMPYFEKGCLTRYLRRLERKTIDQYFAQLCSAVTYLHGKGIVHRDIKTDNVLISDENEAVLTDFGDACFMAPGQSLMSSKKGTLGFMAPESGREKIYDAYKADMYSLGVVLWCMMMKLAIFSYVSLNFLLQMVEESHDLTELDKKMLSGLLESDVSERWTMERLLNTMAESRRSKL